MLSFLFNIPKSIWKKFRNQSRKRKLLIIILAIVVLFLGFRQFRQTHQPSPYQLETAKLGSITEIVSETGNVTNAGVTPVYSTTKGLVAQVFVKNGDFVHKDDDLFNVTATATKQEKDTALSTYLTAKTALETAQATQLSLQATMFSAWDSFKELAQGDDYENDDGTPKIDQRNLPEFHIPQKEWLAAEASYKKQATAINQAQVQASAAWQAYQATQDSQVKAVIDGEIRNLAVTTGDLVTIPTATTLTSTLPALVLKHANAQTTIKLDIGETDVVKVQAGQPTTIELDAFPHQTFTGHVDRIDTYTTPTAGVVNYSVYIVMDQISDLILGGMTADIDITVAQKDNILTVPSSAVKPYEGGRAVRIVGANGEIEYIPVTVGLKGNNLTEIISGIDENTQVIVALKNEQVERSSPGFF